MTYLPSYVKDDNLYYFFCEFTVIDNGLGFYFNNCVKNVSTSRHNHLQNMLKAIASTAVPHLPRPRHQQTTENL